MSDRCSNGICPGQFSVNGRLLLDLVRGKTVMFYNWNRDFTSSLFLFDKDYY